MTGEASVGDPVGVFSGGVWNTSSSPVVSILERCDTECEDLVAGRSTDVRDCMLFAGLSDVELAVAFELKRSIPFGLGFAVDAVDWDLMDCGLCGLGLILSIRSCLR